MAGSTDTFTSGAGKDEAELRRRNVRSYEKANGGAVYTLEAEDTKKTRQKVWSHSNQSVQVGLKSLHANPPDLNASANNYLRSRTQV